MQRASYILGSFIAAAWLPFYTGCSPTLTQDSVRNIVNESLRPVGQRLDRVDDSVQGTKTAVDDLKERVEGVERRVERRISKPPEAAADRVKYAFSNFEPVQRSESESKARREFYEDLRRYLIGLKGRFDFDIDLKKFPPYPSFRKRAKEKEILTFSFVLYDAQEKLGDKGEETRQDHVDELIKILAERTGDPTLAVPVRLDPRPLQEMISQYNATSGVGKSRVGVSSEPKPQPKCVTIMRFNVNVDGIPKDKATLYYQYDKPKAQKTGPQLSIPVEVTHPCNEEPKKDLELTKETVSLMVLLEDEEKYKFEPKSEILVAQYRSISLLEGAERQHPVPLTKEAPACPPPDFDKDGAKAFLEVLKGKNAEFKETLGPHDPRHEWVACK